VLDLVVYGASGFGQQVMFWVLDAQAAGAPWNVLGFVDDDPGAHGDTRTDLPVLGGLDWIEQRGAPLAVVIGIAAPGVKARLAARLRPLGVEFPRVVHPSAVLSRHVTCGEGVLVGAGCVVSVNTVLGDFVTVNHAATIAHDVELGDCATVLPGANVSGNVVVGAGTTIGTNAAVTQGVRIGAHTTVGAGSTVLADLPSHCTAVGTPAVPIKHHEPV